jgi:fibronectin-binding autotransporter adhesin
MVELLILTTGTTLTYGGVIDGSTAFTKSGDGTLLISGTQTYTGATTISAGTLQLGASNLIVNSSTMAVNGTLDLNDYNETFADLSGNGSVDLGSGTLTTIQYNSTTYSGGITGTGDLNKQGGGILTLSGSTDFTGGITIQVGTIKLGANNVIADTNPITFADSDMFVDKATLDLDTYSDTIGTVTADYDEARILLGSGALTVNQATGTNTSFIGTISEDGTFTKSGAGTLTLTNANTYTGLTTISQGTLTLDRAGTTTTGSVIKDTAAVTVNGGILNLADDTETVGVLTLTDGSLTGSGNAITGSSISINTGATDSMTVSAILAGSGNLTKTESGSTELSAANTYSGSTTINAGTLVVSGSLFSRTITNSGTLTVSGALDDLTEISNSGSYNVNETDTIKSVSGSGDIAIANSKTLTTGDNDNDTISGDISGDGGILKTGIGTLTLSGTNSYTGSTTISNGNIKLSGTLSNSTPVSVSNVSTFDVDATNTIGSIAGAGIVDIAPGITLSAGNSSAATTFTGIIRSSQVLAEDGSVDTAYGSFNKVGSEALTVSGTVGRLTTLTISEGSLTLGGDDIINDFTPVVLEDIAGVVFNLNNNSDTIGNLSSSTNNNGGNVTLGSGTLTLNTRSNVTYAGVISGTGSVVKTGFAAQTFTGSNSYTGGTTINAGQLIADADDTLTTTGAVTLSGTADFVIASGVSQTIGDLSSASENSEVRLVGDLTVTQTSEGTFAGVTTSTGAFEKAGAALLILTNDNTHKGNTTISAGTLRIDGGTLSDDTNVIVNGGTFDVDSDDTVRSISGTGGTIDIDSGVTLTNPATTDKTYAGALTGSGTLSNTGISTLTLTGTNTITNIALATANGRLQVSGSGTLSTGTTISVAENAVYYAKNTDTVAGITGAGIVDIAPGITLSAGNSSAATTFTGIIRSSQVLAEDGSVDTAYGSFNKVGSEALTVSGTVGRLTTLTISEGSLTLGGDDIINDFTPVVLEDIAGVVFNLNNNSDTIGNLSSSTNNNGGNVTLGSGTLTLNTRSNVTYAGVISGTGSVVKTGFAAQTFTGSNSYTGGTTINAGQLIADADDTLTTTGAVTLSGTADFVIASGVSQTIGDLSSASENSEVRLVGDLTVTQTSEGTFAGVTTSTGAFEKAGAALLILTNDNTHKGNTTISAGTLRIDGGTLSDDTNVIVNGGTFDVDSDNTVRSISGTGGTIDIDSGVTLTNPATTDKTYAGALTGSGTLSNTGISTLTLTGTNTITNIALATANGRLQVSGSGTLSTGTTISVAENAVYYAKNTDTVAGITGAGIVDIAPGITLSAGNSSAATTFTGIIRSSQVLAEDGSVDTAYGSFNKVGSEALTVSGTVGRLTTLTISEGSLTLGGDDIINDFTPVVLEDIAGVVFNLNNNSDTIGNLSSSTNNNGGNVTLGSGTLTLNTRSNVTYAGVISGTGSVVKTGFAAQTFTGSNSYTGGTTINAGQLIADADDTLTTTGAVTLSGTADFVIASGVSQTIGDLSSASENSEVRLVGDLTVTQTSEGTFAGVTTSTGAFEKAGAALLILTNDNTHKGNTTISAGTLRIDGGTLSDDTNVIVNGGTFDVDSDNTVRSISGTGGTIDIDSGVTLTNPATTDKTYAGALTGSGTLSNTGISTLTLTGTNTITNIALATANGRLQVSGSGTLSTGTTISVAENAVYYAKNTDTVAGITGAGIVDIAPGITLSAGNSSAATTFTGIIRSSQVLAEDGSVDTAYGSFNKVGSEALTVSGTVGRLTTLTISEGSLTLGGDDIINDFTPVVLEDIAGVVFNLNNNSDTIGNLSSSTNNNGGNVTLGSGTLTLNTRSNVTYAGVISGTGSVVKTGFAAQTFTGSNSYTGGTTINAGQLIADADDTLTTTGAVTLSGTADFVIASGVSQTIGDLSSASENSEVRLVGDLTVTQTSEGTFAGVVTNDGSLTKEGSAALIFTNEIKHRGSTTINAGILELGNNSSIGAVTIANIAGAKLDIDGNTATIKTLNGYDNSSIDFGSNGTLIVYQLADGEYQGQFEGNGTLTKRGDSNINRLGSTIQSGNSSINN